MSASKTNTNSKKAAGFWLRFLALLIDGIILTIAGSVWRGMFGMRAYNLVSTVLGAAYAILLWMNWDGQTIGKKLLKIKVVMANGSKLSYQKTILRYLGYILSAIPLGLGYFWMLWDGKKQTWHDKIAGTIVVKA